MKVKHKEASEVVVGAVAGSVLRPESVIAGRYISDGQLVITGRDQRFERVLGVLATEVDDSWAWRGDVAKTSEWSGAV